MSEDRPKRRRLNTVREVCEEYLSRVVTGKTGKAWPTIRTRINEFIAAKGEIALDDLICDDLEKWIEDRPNCESPWTKKGLAQTIKRPFSWAWNKGLTVSHPLKGVSYSKGERGQALTEEQFRMVLREMRANTRRILFFLFWTGCRPGELCSLQWKHIDLEKSVAVLKEHKTAYSTKEPRFIYLPEKAIRLLVWIVNDQRADEEYVFLNQFGRKCKRTDLSQLFRRARKRAGIPASARLYGCRHSFGTRMAVAGVPLKTLSTLMGHTNTLQSEHYIHLAGETEHLHDALEKGLQGKKDKPCPPS